MATALIIDDKEIEPGGVREAFEEAGFEIVHIKDADSARSALINEVPAVALVNARLVSGNGDGDDLAMLADIDLPDISEIYLLSDEADFDLAVQGMRLGASDYFRRPLDVDRLRSNLARRRRELDCEPKDDSVDQRPAGVLVGQSREMYRLRRMLRKVAATEASVLLVGESGTGKELAARYIHKLSDRTACPFVAVNCSAVTEELAESHFFGHRKGAFTGADSDHRGVFSEAAGGTLFLDEVTEMRPELQAKLLRVLESGQFRAVGDDRDQMADVRIVASTNRQPADAVGDGILRKDLYFRLSQFPLRLPPLRDRGEDVVRLAQHFLNEQNQAEGSSKTLSREALEWIRLHDWPGNARELRNVITQAFIIGGDQIGVDDLPDLMLDDIESNAGGGGGLRGTSDATTGVDAASGNPAGDEPPPRNETIPVQVGESLEEAEKKLILATLAKLDGNKSKTAEALGISPKTLYNKLRKYDQDK